MLPKHIQQLDKIIARLEEIKKKESEYNTTIIQEKLLTKEDIMFLLNTSTYIFK